MSSRRKKRSGIVVVLTVVICLLLVLDACLLFQVNRKKALHHENAAPLPDQTVADQHPAQTQSTAEAMETTSTIPTTTKLPILEFPYTAEDGVLVVEGLFQYTGANPECEWVFGENITGVQVTNVSDKHIEQAQIQISLADGSVRYFLIQDLPAGTSATAFSPENEQLDDGAECLELTCQVSVLDQTPLLTDCLQIAAEGTTITVTNVSGSTMTNLVLYCHCSMGGQIFGGTTFEYSVENLTAGEQITVEAEDCFLGEATVVRTEINNS